MNKPFDHDDDGQAAIRRLARRSFVPPYPFRPETRYSAAKLIRLAHRNLIEIFTADSFQKRILRYRLLRRDVLICNDPDMVRSVFQTQHEIFQRKTPQMRNALRPLLGDGLFVSDGALWAERRAAVAPIIHASQIPRFAPVMIKVAEDHRDGWLAAGEGARLDVRFEMAELTAEIICQSIFGARLGREYTKEIVAGFTDYQDRVDQFDIPSMVGAPDWLPRYRSPSFRRSLKRVHRVIDRIIDRVEEQHRCGVAQDHAIIHRLFAAKDRNGRPFSREAIRNEAIVIFMAGHETTANTLAWAFYLISQSPRVRKALNEELDRVVGDRPVAYEDYAKLIYTRAIIEETLRLYPPVPFLGREAQRGGVINGKPVKEHSLVLVVPWLLQRHKKVWPAPDAFVPERFDPRRFPRPPKYAYVPFAIGPRICPGMVFGLTEAVLCLAVLTQSVELTLEEGHQVRPICQLTLRPGAELPMRVRPRRRRTGRPARAAAAS